MDAAEIESEGEELRALADLDDEPATGMQFAARLPWVFAITRVWSDDKRRAWRAENDDGLDTIFVHRGIRELGRNWLVASEGVEGYLTRREPALVDPNLKALAWQITSASLLPRYGFRRSLSVLGLDLRALSAHWSVSQTVVARRVAEVRGLPFALITAQKVLRAGLELSAPQLAVLVHRGGSRHYQVLELSDVKGWIVWPRE